MTADIYTSTPDCCPFWPRLRESFAWMAFAEAPHIYTMPCIMPNASDRIRVSYCPSCGADRRLVTWNTEDE